MKKLKVLTTPMRVTEIDLDDLYEDDNWKLKAERLQARRWRQLKHQVL